MTEEQISALVDRIVDEHFRNSAVSRAGVGAWDVVERAAAALKAAFVAVLCPPAAVHDGAAKPDAPEEGA